MNYITALSYSCLISLIACTNASNKDSQRQDKDSLQVINAPEQDQMDSTDRKMLDFLLSYFKKRDADLCVIYRQLYDLEGETIKEADKKYPDFGVEHSNYQSRLYNAGKKKIFKKYKIADSLSIYINVFGLSYCK